MQFLQKLARYAEQCEQIADFVRVDGEEPKSYGEISYFLLDSLCDFLCKLQPAINLKYYTHLFQYISKVRTPLCLSSRTSRSTRRRSSSAWTGS